MVEDNKTTNNSSVLGVTLPGWSNILFTDTDTMNSTDSESGLDLSFDTTLDSLAIGEITTDDSMDDADDANDVQVMSDRTQVQTMYVVEPNGHVVSK